MIKPLSILFQNCLEIPDLNLVLNALSEDRKARNLKPRKKKHSYADVKHHE